MAILTITSSGTLGDHFPYLALGKALVEHGHQVRYAGQFYLQSHVEACGMEFHHARPEMDREIVKARPGNFDHWKVEKGGRPTFSDEEMDIYEIVQFEDRLADVVAASRGSDLLLCSHLQPVGRMVSELNGIPWVTLCVTPWFHPSDGTSAAKGIHAREDAGSQLPSARRFYAKMNRLRIQMGLQAIPDAELPKFAESSRVLLGTSPHFGKPAPREDCEIIQTGFWLHHPPQWSAKTPSNALIQCIEKNPEPVVLSFSSQPLRESEAFLNVHLAAAQRLGRLLVVQSGWAGLDSADLQAAIRRGEACMLPEGPQEWTFSRAGAVITHGGIGTVARALRSGSPLLVEPFGNDQFYNARQVVALGIGAAVNPHRLTVKGLVPVLQKVLAPEVKQRAQRLSKELDSDSLGQACRAIDTWLDQTRSFKKSLCW